MARLSFRAALLGDAAPTSERPGWYGLSARAGLLSPGWCFAAIALTGLRRAGADALCAPRLGQPAVAGEVRERLLGVRALGALLGVATSLSIHGAVVAFLLRGGRGRGVSGGLELLGVTHPVMLSLGNIIVPPPRAPAGRAGDKQHGKSRCSTPRRAGCCCLPYVVALWLSPAWLLGSSTARTRPKWGATPRSAC